MRLHALPCFLNELGSLSAVECAPVGREAGELGVRQVIELLWLLMLLLLLLLLLLVALLSHNPNASK